MVRPLAPQPMSRVRLLCRRLLRNPYRGRLSLRVVRRDRHLQVVLASKLSGEVLGAADAGWDVDRLLMRVDQERVHLAAGGATEWFRGARASQRLTGEVLGWFFRLDAYVADDEERDYLLELPLEGRCREGDPVVDHHFEKAFEIGDEDVLQGGGRDDLCVEVVVLEEEMQFRVLIYHVTTIQEPHHSVCMVVILLSRGRVGNVMPGMKRPILGAPHAQAGHGGGEGSGEEIVGSSYIDGFLDKSIVEGKSKLDGELLIGAVLLCEGKDPATVSCAS